MILYRKWNRIIEQRFESGISGCLKPRLKLTRIGHYHCVDIFSESRLGQEGHSETTYEYATRTQAIEHIDQRPNSFPIPDSFVLGHSGHVGASSVPSLRCLALLAGASLPVGQIRSSRRDPSTGHSAFAAVLPRSPGAESQPNRSALAAKPYAFLPWSWFDY